jgi:hypothetical protein
MKNTLSRLMCACGAGTHADVAWQLQQQLASAPASAAHVAAAAQPLFDTAEGLETPIQLIYLTALLGFLAAGAYLVVRQVLIRRELDEAAKSLGERIRTGEATCEVRHTYPCQFFSSTSSAVTAAESAAVCSG